MLLANKLPASSNLLLDVVMPLKTADQAARLVWFIESRPRATLGWMSVVKMSSSRQSLVGIVSTRAAPPT